MPIGRRTFLSGSLAALAAAACTGSNGEGSAPTSGTAPSTPGVPTLPPTVAPSTAPTTLGPPPADLPADPFRLGIGSGDPLPDRVILWTRLAPDPAADGGGMPAEVVPVLWEVATDDTFASIVASGIVDALAESAHTLHVDAGGLAPDTRYAYRFRVGPWTSPVGRTRTMPADDASPGTLTIGHGSCQHFETGFYAAHRDVAASGLDLMVWLGDYIYEGARREVGDGRVRAHEGPECTTLADYRRRYAQYRTDPDLQAAHASCPWLVIWDDHEVENNYAGAVSEEAAPAEEFLARRAAAYQAWYEHQPVRLDPPTGPDLIIHRIVRAGSLATFFLLDGRQHRTDQACGDVTLELGPACPEVTSPGRTMLGDEQEQWLAQGLAGSATTWNVLANQVVLADLGVGQSVLNYDQWDGYPEARRRLLDTLARLGRGSTVVLTGDIHLALVADLEGPEGGLVATELVGTSISSEGNVPEAFEALVGVFRTVRYADLRHRGWVRSVLTADSWVAEYRIVADVADPASDVVTDAAFAIAPGKPGAEAVTD